MSQHPKLVNRVIVNEPASELRALSRMSLKGLWDKALIGVIIYELMLSLVPQIVELIFPSTKITYQLPMTEEIASYGIAADYTVTMSSISMIYGLLLSGPIAVGFIRFLFLIVRRREVRNQSLFEGFQHFGKAFLLQFLIGILSFLWVFPVMLVATLLMSFIPILAIVSVVGMAAMIIWIFARYSMATYFLADDWNLGIMECIKLSVESMKGNKGQLIILYLSFFGWMLLGAVPEAILNPLIVGISPLLQIILRFLVNVPRYAVALYVNVALTFFYEIMTGHLRRQEPIQTTYSTPQRYQ